MTPVELNTRLALYVGLAFFTTLIANPQALHSAKDWIDWFVLIATAVVQAGLAARAYLDKSSGQPGVSTGYPTTSSQP